MGFYFCVCFLNTRSHEPILLKELYIVEWVITSERSSQKYQNIFQKKRLKLLLFRHWYQVSIIFLLGLIYLAI